MAVTATKGTGIARTYALVFGIAYIAVALLEVILGSKGLYAGHTLLLKITPLQNAVHWLVGVAVLASYFAGERSARGVARIVGIVFVVLTIVGFVARTSTGKFLGFHGPLPWSYNFVHLATAILALFAGFAAERAYGHRAIAA